MEHFLKASAVIAIFYLIYKLFLQRETFFEQNRWFLLIGLISAFLLPFLVIPIYVETTPFDFSNYVFETTPVTENFEKPFNILDYLPLVYGLGVLFFSTRFLIHFASLALIIFKNKGEKISDFTFIKTTNKVSPFSFFNWIVYNPKDFSKTELEQIITHEKIHANQKHSLDILLTHICCIVLWFNPFMWLFSKVLKQNLEFIADRETAKKISCKKSYQYTLLKTSIPSHQVALSNPFYNSLIKKRIVMLHKSKSKKINQLKYALIIPVLGLFLMSFNTKEVYVEKVDINLENVNQTEPEPPLYFVDGNETSKKDVESINPENIDSINVLKGKVAIEKYGDKGKHGVIEITTNWKTKSILGEEMDDVKVTGYAKTPNSVLKTKNDKKTNIINNEDQLNPWKITIGRNAVSDYPDSDSLNWRSTKKRVGLNWVSEEDSKVSLSSKNEKKTKSPWAITMSASKSENALLSEQLGENALYILDGKEITKKELDNLDPNEIYSAQIFTDNAYNKKYGDKGKNGIIEVTTKKFNTKSTSTKTLNVENNLKETLILLDGNEITPEEFNNLDFDNVTINTFAKGVTDFEKYENQEKNIVWEITTKKKK